MLNRQEQLVLTFIYNGEITPGLPISVDYLCAKTKFKPEKVRRILQVLIKHNLIKRMKGHKFYIKPIMSIYPDVCFSIAEKYYGITDGLHQGEKRELSRAGHRRSKGSC